MTIIRRLGIGYSLVGFVYILILVWLWYHEFVQEPAVFAAHGVSDLHEDMAAEFYTVCSLALIPILLSLAWLWTRRVLAPLRALTHAAEQIESNKLNMPLPRSMNQDEVDKLAVVLDSMKTRLDESFRQIREFTLHASHELKTPLTIMQAQLETVLHEHASLSESRVEWLESMLDEVQRLAKIVDSLTLLTRAEGGILTLESTPVQFSELVREAFEDAIIMGQVQNVKVMLDHCDDIWLSGDRHRLRQLLLILLDNAIKYNRPEGEIHITLRKQKCMAELQITNDGGSIESNHQQRLFKRFVRGENAVDKAEGCGLGLTIAQWIVQATGGSIELIPEAGDRTTAFVRFPITRIAESTMDTLVAV